MMEEQAYDDPAFLMRCIPGCRSMREIAPDRFAVSLSIQLAAVGGTFEGSIALSEKLKQHYCLIAVTGQGTLGHGSGEARSGSSRRTAGRR
jgi:carbon monoxide dehydrogenase subunit G